VVALTNDGSFGRTNRRIATRAALRDGGAGVVVSTDADRIVAGWLLPTANGGR
jgi:hypothetical protein